MLITDHAVLPLSAKSKIKRSESLKEAIIALVCFWLAQAMELEFGDKYNYTAMHADTACMATHKESLKIYIQSRTVSLIASILRQTLEHHLMNIHSVNIAWWTRTVHLCSKTMQMSWFCGMFKVFILSLIHI